MLRRILAAAFFVLASLATAAAQERITDFSSDIAIASTGTLTVRETIAVVAENDRIEHGIFRDFPTTYTDRLGKRVRVRFDVDEVTLDGQPAHYELENIDNGRRVRIGDADTTVSRGAHTYVLVYKTDRQIGFFDTYDELYWNVTGNGWAFRIERAEAAIHLPSGATVAQTASYTGPQGATGTNARESRGGGIVRFATTEALDEHEGLTVAVGFSKGAVTPPTQQEQTQQFLRDNAATGAALAGLVALSVFYFVTWFSFGRDPARGTIIPLFEPPKNFSAAAVRFVHRMAYDRKCFAASLIAMAVKGYLKISEAGGTYTLTRTGKSERDTGLASTESAIAREFFGTRDRIELKNTNHSSVSRAISNVRDALKREDQGVYFVTNSGWFFAGMGIIAVSAITAALLSADAVPAIFILIWLGGWTAGTSHLLIEVYHSWMEVVSGPGSRFVNAIGAIVLTIFAVPFTAGIVFGVVILGASLPPLTLIPIMAQGVLAAIFYRLLKAPTLMGAKIRDQIDGFRLFLNVAEKNRLEVLNPPKVTPEVFEKYLPYAIALDAENAWSKHFEQEAARAAALGETQTTYTPLWYSGSSFSRLGTAGFASAIGASVASATASASSAPGSSSGSGGGGSSGGGGGGGGGGGW